MARKKWKRNKTQRALDEAKATELRAQGQSLKQISDQLDVCPKTVLNDLNKVDAALKIKTESERQKHIDRLSAELEWARAESKKAWAGQAGNSITKTNKTGEFGYEITQIHKSKAHPGHITNIIRAVDSEAKLLKLDKPADNDSNEMDEADLIIAEQLRLSKRLRDLNRDS